ncbi:DUF7577 domain-containing protein [Halorubrum laminariae]|uniref:Zinc ribbon domain-containing protein n=1 Tax=Halorubrum laminariae TaxID=1433523 RepID=A0ABD6C1T6_9EURY|nr:zinc ribbon domain-containing protein [Halorubrum laminariae]
MSGELLVPIAAVFGTLALTLASAWLLFRRDTEADTLLGGERIESSGNAPDASARSVSGDGSVAGGVPSGDPPLLDADGETVTCRHCGAENRPTFRYCRWCVNDGFAGGESDAAAGPTMTERSL